MIIQINLKKAKYSSVGLEDDMFIYSTNVSELLG